MGALYDQGQLATSRLAAALANTTPPRCLACPQPYLNEVRFIGNVPTPWHSWAIVATPATLSSSSSPDSPLHRFLSELSDSIHAFDAPSARTSSSKEFVEQTWEYPTEDVKAWLKQVEYPTGQVNEISRPMVEKTLRCVVDSGVPPRWSGSCFVRS